WSGSWVPANRKVLGTGNGVGMVSARPLGVYGFLPAASRPVPGARARDGVAHRGRRPATGPSLRASATDDRPPRARAALQGGQTGKPAEFNRGAGRFRSPARRSDRRSRIVEFSRIQ